MHESLSLALEKIEQKLNSAEIDRQALQDRMNRVEQKGSAAFGEKPGDGTDGVGERFAKQFAESADLFQKTGRLKLEIKAAGDAVTTASGRTLAWAGMGGPDRPSNGFQQALKRRSRPGTTAVEYSRYTGLQGAADVQAAEGDTKAALRPDHSLITQQAITIAGFTKVSEQSLADMRDVAQIIGTVIQRSIEIKLDQVLVLGNTTPAFPGYAALATASTSLIYTAMVDAISEGVAAMQTVGFLPDTVSLNPADWLALNVAKATDGQYLSGSYLSPLPQELRGLKIVISQSIPAGKALLLDSEHSELGTVDAFSIEMARDGNDFTKNLITMRGEIRVVPVFRSVGSARLITPKAP